MTSYHADVRACVRAEAQDEAYGRLRNGGFLTPEEADVLRWGRNATGAPRGAGRWARGSRQAGGPRGRLGAAGGRAGLARVCRRAEPRTGLSPGRVAPPF